MKTRLLPYHRPSDPFAASRKRFVDIGLSDMMCYRPSNDLSIVFRGDVDLENMASSANFRIIMLKPKRVKLAAATVTVTHFGLVALLLLNCPMNLSENISER